MKQKQRVIHESETACPLCGEVTRPYFTKAWSPGTHVYRCSLGHSWEHDIQLDDPLSEEFHVAQEARREQGLPPLSAEETNAIYQKHGKTYHPNAKVTMSLHRDSEASAEINAVLIGFFVKK